LKRRVASRHIYWCRVRDSLPAEGGWPPNISPSEPYGPGMGGESAFPPLNRAAQRNLPGQLESPTLMREKVSRTGTNARFRWDRRAPGSYTGRNEWHGTRPL